MDGRGISGLHKIMCSVQKGKYFSKTFWFNCTCETIYYLFTLSLFYVCLCSTKLNWEQILLYRIERSAVYFHFYVLHWKLGKEYYFRALFKNCHLPCSLVVIYTTINFSAPRYQFYVAMSSLGSKFLYHSFALLSSKDFYKFEDRSIEYLNDINAFWIMCIVFWGNWATSKRKLCVSGYYTVSNYW